MDRQNSSDDAYGNKNVMKLKPCLPNFNNRCQEGNDSLHSHTKPQLHFVTF